jgi:phenolic acid decarboxylase
MTAQLKGFARFWYRFFVGDDWTIALGVALALAITYLVKHTMIEGWWITPVVALILLARSVYRAAKPDDGSLTVDVDLEA